MLFVRVFSSPFYTLLALKELHRLISHHILVLEDSGFDFSMLSEFRSRLIEGHAEYLLFETMLIYFKQQGLVKVGSRQRTDATHVLAKVRAFNHALIVGEILRAALNSLAVVVPAWLHFFASPEWYERYDHRVEESRPPRDKAALIALVETMGADGSAMLIAIYMTPELQWLQQLPAYKRYVKSGCSSLSQLKVSSTFELMTTFRQPPN